MAATVLGRYELLRLLGRGGMADVYLARRRVAGLEKRLVIKRVRPARSGDTTFLDLFVREARLSMTLNHQNIVPVFDFGRVGDAAFLAMEHVEGRDLGATLARAKGPPPPLLAAFIAAECCQALDHAHNRRGNDGAPLGVVHRDVTPRNVLLSWDGAVKLTDFGVAALAGDPGGDVRGTIAYMAPEQARYQPTDARADLYGLGLVLWELVAGQRVRRGRGKPEMLEDTRAGTLPELPAGPPALIAVIARATQLDPAARFPDAAAMLAALDRYLVEARAAAPGPAPARQLADWLQEAWGDEAGKVEGEPLEGARIEAPADGDLDPLTMRSLAETVAAVEVVVAAPVRERPAAIAPPAAVVAPAVSRRYLLATALVAAAGLVVVAWLVIGGGRGGVQRVVVDAAVTVDARVAVDAAASVDAGGVVDGGGGDAAVASSVDASPGRAPADASTRTADPEAGSAGADAGTGATAGRRKVTIGATPWADFTVDDDPTPHQTPETIELPPGRHRIHFANARLGVTRTVVIEVPVDRDLRHVEPLEP